MSRKRRTYPDDVREESGEWKNVGRGCYIKRKLPIYDEYPIIDQDEEEEMEDDRD